MERYAQRNNRKGKKTVRNILNVGDLELVFKESTQNKLAQTLIKEYKVIKILEPDVYEVQKSKSILRTNKKYVKEILKN